MEENFQMRIITPKEKCYFITGKTFALDDHENKTPKEKC